MRHNQTVGKCCYCGQKTVVERGQASCGSCGAPITKFASLDAIHPQTVQAPQKIKPKMKHSAQPRLKSAPNRKKKKSGLKRFIDLVEDVVDIFD